jgi:hypothetical protein
LDPSPSAHHWKAKTQEEELVRRKPRFILKPKALRLHLGEFRYKKGIL